VDPGFQVRGAHLKKIAPSGGRRENIWGISCEKSYFFPILSTVEILGSAKQYLVCYIHVYITASLITHARCLFVHA
jgi:hypothetical protein